MGDIAGWLMILGGLWLGYYSGYWFEDDRFVMFTCGMLGMLGLFFVGLHLSFPAIGGS